MTDIKTIIFKTSKNIRVEKHRRRVINLRFKRDSRVEIFIENFLRGGRGEIRTRGDFAASPVFKTGALVHYATLPNKRFVIISQLNQSTKFLYRILLIIFDLFIST